MANEIIRSLPGHGRDRDALQRDPHVEGGETLNLPANTVHGTASWTAESIGLHAVG
jgi:hypothetical protein